MTAIRSVLWVGSATGLAKSGLPESSRFDVVWEPELEAARQLDLTAFHQVIFEVPELKASMTPPFPVPEGVEWTPLATGERPCGLAAKAPAREDEPRVLHGLLVASDAMQRVLDLTLQMSPSLAPVLVTGETGTGKERIARVLHAASHRSAGPFVPVNCAAIPETLLESELFGHVRGAFSGADRDRIGLIESANGGTLFLDEIGEASASVQATLLRVLQEKRVRPVGSSRERKVDVRVVTATHRDLRARVRAMHFREDLFYRLAVLSIHVPPLREHKTDIRPLVCALLAREKDERREISKSAWEALLRHDWPGNVRELESQVTRARALAAPDGPIEPHHFAPSVLRAEPPFPNAPPSSHVAEPLRSALERVERWLIRERLAENDGHRSATAKQLGITREGLYKKMQRLGIE